MHLIYHKLSFGSFPESFFCVMDVVAAAIAATGAVMPFVCIRPDDDEFNTSIFDSPMLYYYLLPFFLSSFQIKVN